MVVSESWPQARLRGELKWSPLYVIFWTAGRNFGSQSYQYRCSYVTRHNLQLHQFNSLSTSNYISLTLYLFCFSIYLRLIFHASQLVWISSFKLWFFPWWVLLLTTHLFFILFWQFPSLFLSLYFKWINIIFWFVVCFVIIICGFVINIVSNCLSLF